MKVISVLALVIVCLQFSAVSYSQSSEDKVSYNKNDVAAATISLPYPPDVVEDAIKEYLNSKSAKSEKSKGFVVFRHARFSEKDTDIQDLYTKVERRSRQQKDESVVYLFVGKNGEDMSKRLSTDRYKMNEARSLLEEMMPHIEAFNLEVNIKDQESQIKKAERKLQGLETDRVNIEKRIRELKDRLEENKLDHEKQVLATDALKQKLQDLIGKRKS